MAPSSEACVRTLFSLEMGKMIDSPILRAANHVLDEKKAADKTEFRQLDLFTDFTGGNEKKQQDEKLEREKKMQEAVLSIKKKYGKNAILKGLNFQEGATTKARNEQIGGHKA